MIQRLALSLACLFCACGDGAATRPVSAGSAIVGGTPTTGAPTVVALLVGGELVCTGTLVTPRVVVTAAHCVSEFTGALALPEVFFGADVHGEGVRRATVAARVHPAFDRLTRQHDLAALLLETAAPTGETSPLNTTPLDDTLLGAPLHLVGFGSTGGASPTFGVKHEGWTTLSQYDAGSFTFLPDPAQTCGGDSGGPAFLSVGGVEKLAGVTSSGDPACSGFGRDTRVDVYVGEFLIPFIGDTAEGVARPGQPCFDGPNCLSGLCLTALDEPRLRHCSSGCVSSAECPPGMGCVTGPDGGLACRYPVPTPGALGAACLDAGECVSELCARSSADAGRSCTLRCFQENEPPCPAGYQCGVNADQPAHRACFASPPGSGCGCRASGLAQALLLAAAMLRRRQQPAQPKSYISQPAGQGQ